MGPFSLFKKRYGQHFLSDTNILKRIVAFAGIEPMDTVVEIGPGGGALTLQLAQQATRVVAIEIDRDLISPLRSAAPHNVEVIEADALSFDFSRIAEEPYHLVGNLPYNVATPLFRRFIGFRRSIRDVTVMIQKEVADRIVAGPGSAAYGPLSVLVQYYAAPRYGFTVAPGSFRPKPKVDSAVIRLEWRAAVADADDFTDFVHRAFASRRKKLANNLGRMYPEKSRGQLLQTLSDVSVPPDARPENLSVEEFLRLYNQICRH
jgi:16S rRNA (adenine1518-N6/adenine1519-N6)-dimethyltransferase